MLHKQTVDGNTFALLKELMSYNPLSDFSLVGGTALSLMLGHRKSVDLDFFSIKKFDVLAIRKKLKAIWRQNYHSFFGKESFRGVLIN